MRVVACLTSRDASESPSDIVKVDAGGQFTRIRRMKFFLPGLLAMALSSTVVSATDQMVTLGDSLTFSYESEFCFQRNIIGYGNVGDGFPASVRNWAEILSNPIYRGSRFGLGTRDDVHVTLPFNAPFDQFFRQRQNWAIPGLKVDGLRRFLLGEATFTQLVGASAEFSLLATLLTNSDFNDSRDFNHLDLETQIQGTAQRMVIFIGGNDITEIYDPLYYGVPAGTFVADFMADMVVILDKIQTLKPDLEIVLVNLPHPGITPKVRGLYPFNAVATERVSVVLRELNAQLASEAAARNIGYADVYTPTLPMIEDTRNLCVHGINFANSGTTTGAADFAWLNGTLSKNFHPNTNAQAMIANEIIHAFNKRYRLGIPRLSSAEIHHGISPKTPVENIDMTFAVWMDAFGLGGEPASDDSDGDGIAARSRVRHGLEPHPQ